MPDRSDAFLDVEAVSAPAGFAAVASVEAGFAAAASVDDAGFDFSIFSAAIECACRAALIWSIPQGSTPLASARSG